MLLDHLAACKRAYRYTDCVEYISVLRFVRGSRLFSLFSGFYLGPGAAAGRTGRCVGREHPYPAQLEGRCFFR
ncbi:hypothetical protein D3C78_1378930 [compost metagenome]